MTKFTFDPDVPEIVRPELEKYLLPHEWIIPAWCSDVLIGWRAQDPDGAAIDAQVNYEYRWARLTFYACFLEQRDSVKREQVIHDLLHLASGVLADYARDTIKLLLPEKDAPIFREHALEELRCRHESFVQDLALCVVGKLYGQKVGTLTADLELRLNGNSDTSKKEEAAR